MNKLQAALERIRQQPPPLEAPVPVGNLPPPMPHVPAHLPPPPMPTGHLPPPPPPPHMVGNLPPPPTGNLPPPPGAGPPGPRGVSNLPAWMTKQQQPPPPEEPATKRLKVEATTTPVDLKVWITQQIQLLLGEPEASLVTFIHNHVTSQPPKPIADLLPELQEVLDEDASAFLEKLQHQVAVSRGG